MKKVDTPNQIGMPPLYTAIIYNNSASFQELLELKETDVNASNYIGMPPVHFAIFFEKFEHAYILLKLKETNVNAIANNGQTALHYAAKSNNSKVIPLILLLIKKGINVSIKNKDGQDALTLAKDLVKDCKNKLLMYKNTYTDQTKIETINKKIETINNYISNNLKIIDCLQKVSNKQKDEITKNLNNDSKSYFLDDLEDDFNLTEEQTFFIHTNDLDAQDQDVPEKQDALNIEEKQTFLMHENKPDAQSQDVFGQNAFEQNALDQDQDQDILGE